MVIYPEITSTIAKFWQVGKWLNEVAPDELTPMWADREHSPNRHFYINEIAHTREGRYLVPRQWVIYNGKEHADAQITSINDQVCSKFNR
jgi:hypothetical protein